MSPASNEQHISRAANTEYAEPVERVETGTAAVGQDHEAAGKKHAESRSGKVKAILNRVFKRGRRRDTTPSLDKSGAERIASSHK